MTNIGLLTNWFNKKIVEPLLEILRRGAEPKLLAFSAAVGFTIGLFPICGTTVIICGLAIASLGSHCHAPTVMTINLIATPVELSLVVPFLRFGEYISGGPHFPLTSDAMKKVLTLQASNEVLLSIAHALLGWLVAAPLIFAAVYILSLPLFKVLVHKFRTVPLSPKRPLSPSEVRLKVELGLKKEHREMLPIIVYNQSFSVRDTQCAVCLGDYQAEDRLQQIPACGHTFHIDCIDSWLSTHTTCPLCRLSLLSSHKSQNESPVVPVELSHASSVAEDNVLSLALTPRPCEAEATQLSGLRNGEPRTVQNSSEDDARGSQCVDSTRELRDARIKNEVYEHTGGSSA